MNTIQILKKIYIPVFNINKDFSVDMTDNKIDARKHAQRALKESCPIDYSVGATGSPTERIEALTKCLESQLHSVLDLREQEMHFQASVRQSLGTKLADYACSDKKQNTTVSLFNDTLVDGKQSYNKQVLFFNDQGGQLAIVDNLLTLDESQGLRKSLTDNSNLSSEETVTTEMAKKKLSKLVGSIAPQRDDLQIKGFQIKSFQPLEKQGLAVSVLDDREGPPLASIIVFGSTQGALHFPRVGVHIRSSPGLVALLIYGRGDATDETGYIGDYRICLKEDQEGDVTYMEGEIAVTR